MTWGELEAQNGETDTVRALLKAGADPRAKNNNERRVLDFTHSSSKHPDIAGLLRESMATGGGGDGGGGAGED